MSLTETASTPAPLTFALTKLGAQEWLNSDSGLYSALPNWDKCPLQGLAVLAAYHQVEDAVGVVHQDVVQGASDVGSFIRNIIVVSLSYTL